jgi:hypothetical protein
VAGKLLLFYRFPGNPLQQIDCPAICLLKDWKKFKFPIRRFLRLRHGHYIHSVQKMQLVAALLGKKMKQANTGHQRY